MATTQVTLQEDAWVEITSSAFLAQNQSDKTFLIRSDSSLPSASETVGFRLRPEASFNYPQTGKTWYGTIESKGTDTAPLIIDED